MEKSLKNQDFVANTLIIVPYVENDKGDSGKFRNFISAFFTKGFFENY